MLLLTNPCEPLSTPPVVAAMTASTARAVRAERPARAEEGNGLNTGGNSVDQSDAASFACCFNVIPQSQILTITAAGPQRTDTLRHCPTTRSMSLPTTLDLSYSHEPSLRRVVDRASWQ